MVHGWLAGDAPTASCMMSAMSIFSIREQKNNQNYLFYIIFDIPRLAGTLYVVTRLYAYSTDKGVNIACQNGLNTILTMPMAAATHPIPIHRNNVGLTACDTVFIRASPPSLWTASSPMTSATNSRD